MYLMKFRARNTHFLWNKFRMGQFENNRSYKNVSFQDIPDVSPAQIKSVLKANKVSFEEGITTFITPCVFCKRAAKQVEESKIYINKKTGSFVCSCSYSNQWQDIKQFLTVNYKKITKEKDKDHFKESRDSKVLVDMAKLKEYIKKVNSSTTLLSKLDEDVLKEILNKFELTMIPDDIFKSLDVRIDSLHTKLYFPLRNNFPKRILGYKVLHIDRTVTLEPILPNLPISGLLFSRPPNKSRETVILVPNMLDFLVLLASKVPGTIMLLPNGLVTLSQFVLPVLEDYNKIILWLGEDTLAWDTARMFARKLGEKRCLVVKPYEETVLPSERYNQDFRGILASAQPIWHKSITTFASLRADVLSDLMNIDKVQGIKWARFPTLNKILKGHRKGELTVITGPTGSGKTTFISEYSLDLAMQGVTTLWGSFEIRNARLARTMLQQMAGIQLDENLDQYDKWADLFEALPMYFMTFHGQQSVKVVMEAVEHAAYVHDIAHIIIDNVQFMMGMSDESRHMDRFWKQDAIIAAFRTFATRRNCHVTLVIHPRKEREDEDLTTSSIFGGAKASQEADNVLIIQDKRLTSMRGKKFLQVAKNRYSGDLGIMQMDFDKDSLSFAPKKVNKKSSEEIRPTDYSTVDNNKTVVKSTDSTNSNDSDNII